MHNEYSETHSMHLFTTNMQPFAIVVLAIVHFLTKGVSMPVSIAC